MDGRVLKSNDFLWKENQRLREENELLHEQLQKREDCSRQLAQLRQKHEKVIGHNTSLRWQVADLKEQLKTRPRPAPPPFIKQAAAQKKHPKRSEERRVGKEGREKR